MATVNDIVNGLPVAARGVETVDLIRHLNYDVKNDMREYLYSDFEQTYTGEMVITHTKPQPLTATVISVAGSVGQGDYRYKVSFFFPYGEGPAGFESEVISISGFGSQVQLSNIPTYNGALARKVYRQYNGSGDFKLITTIGDNTQTTYTDNVANIDLGNPAKEGYTLPSDYYDYKSLSCGNILIPIYERNTINQTSWFGCMNFWDNPDGTQSRVISFSDAVPYEEIVLKYYKDIPDVENLNDSLPYPVGLHARLLPILRLGVSLYHLSELTGEDDHVAKISARYDSAIANTFNGNITRNL